MIMRHILFFCGHISIGPNNNPKPNVRRFSSFVVSVPLDKRISSPLNALDLRSFFAMKQWSWGKENLR